MINKKRLILSNRREIQTLQQENYTLEKQLVTLQQVGPPNPLPNQVNF